MPYWVQIVLAALTVAREFMKYQRSHQSCKASRAESAKKFADELKEAREKKDVKKLESVFGRVGDK